MLSLLASCFLVFESLIYGQQLPAGECCAHSSLKLKILLAYCTILEGENTIYRPVWAVQMYDPARLKSGTRQAHLIPQRCLGLVLRGSKVCSYFFHFLFNRSYKLFLHFFTDTVADHLSSLFKFQTTYESRSTFPFDRVNPSFYSF